MIMNKLVFNDGGQPVYLEDLRLLQDNMRELILSLFLHSYSAGNEDIAEEPERCDDGIEQTTGGAVYATARHKNGCADINMNWLQPHKLITDDGVFDVEGYTIEDGYTEEDLYYVLKEEIVETRIFEDGQERPVIAKCTAQIVTEKPGTGNWYPMTEVLSFDELLEKIGRVRFAKRAEVAERAWGIGD